MARIKWLLLICTSHLVTISALSAVKGAKRKPSLWSICLSNANLTKTATDLDICLEQLVKTQLTNVTEPSTCATVHDFDAKINTFCDTTVRTCYNGTRQDAFVRGKKAVMDMFTFIFGGNKLREISAKNYNLSCIDNIRENITNCKNFKTRISNNTNSSYLWYRRSRVHYEDLTYSRTQHIQNCMNPLLEMICPQPVQDFVNSLFNIALKNAKENEPAKNGTIPLTPESSPSKFPYLAVFLSLFLFSVLFFVLYWYCIRNKRTCSLRKGGSGNIEQQLHYNAKSEAIE